MTAGPIFVGGGSRSGKTLVRVMLSSHSRIVVSRRTEMWPRFFGRFGDLGRRENLERCLEAMLARPHIAALAPDPELLCRQFLGGKPSYARLFALVHEQYAARQGKARWGDQTGDIERFTPELMAAYPGARLLHLIRDPRDQYAAILSKHRAGVGRWTAAWLSSAASAEEHLRQFPASYMAVRYEDLATDPTRIMRDVCAFLGERFEPEMARMAGARRYDRVRASTGGNPVTTAFIGTYRDLGESDLALIQKRAGERMRSWGYSPEPIALSLSGRLRCAVAGWPVGRARARKVLIR